MHVHMRLQPRVGNTAHLGLPSRLLFLQQEILFQHNLRILLTKPHRVFYRCMSVSAKTHQHHLDWTECTWELLEYPKGCPGQARQIPAHSKLRKCAHVSAWETQQVCDKPTERCSQTAGLRAHECWTISSWKPWMFNSASLLHSAYLRFPKLSEINCSLRNTKTKHAFSEYKLWSCKWLILIMEKICHV